MALKQLNNIDKRTKYSVFGWIRNQERELKLHNVPQMISSICILYLRDDEIFDIIAKLIKLSENRKMITRMRWGFQWDNNNYGKMEVNSTNNIIYKWHLKIIEMSRKIEVGVRSKHNGEYYGVEVSTFNENKMLKLTHNKIPSYKLNWDNYCVHKFEKGDEITICLNLKQQHVQFIVNSIDKGIAFTNIETSKDIKYRIYVLLEDTGDCLEILNFTKQ